MWSVNEAPPRQLHNRFRPVPVEAQEARLADTQVYDQLRECLAVIRRALAPFREAFDAVVTALSQPGPHTSLRCPVT